MLRQPRDEQIEHLQELITALRSRLRVLDRQIAAFGMHAPAPTLLDREQAEQQLKRAEADLRRLQPASEHERKPYLGLNTFSEQDADLFFGRDELVADLLTRLERHSFLAVLGPSGSGKSSLVRAGLIPALRGGSLPGSEHWRYVIMRPGQHPLDELAAALVRLARGDVAAALSLSRQMEQSDRALSVAANMLADGEEQASLVLVVDQAEELWTLGPKDPQQRDEWVRREQQPFIRQLLGAVAENARTAGSPRMRIILTMRADFLHRVADQPDLAHLVGEHDVIVCPMSESELRDAIVRPAEAAGYDFEPGLVYELIEQVRGQPGALPLLEYTLLELWNKRAPGGTLTWQAFEEMGRVEGAVSARADTILSIHYETPELQGQLRQVLLRLVQPGEGTADTRRRVPLQELVPADQSPEVIRDILQPLADERLISVGHDLAGDSATVEIAHEALIRAWPTFAAWIDASRADLRLQLQLTDSAAEWVRHGKKREFLWTGLRLEQALDWQDRARPQLNTTERAFLEASRIAQRRATYTRWATLGSIMLLLVIIAGGALFFAQRQRQLADERLAAIRTAEAAQQQAERQSRLALARQLASQSLIYQPNDREVATLLAAQAISVTLTADGFVDPDADRALRAALPISDTRTSLRGHARNPNRAFFDPSGRLIASSGGDSFALIWDARTGEQLFKLDGHGPSKDDPSSHSIQMAAFSPSGDRLVTAGVDGTIKIWDVSTGDELRTLHRHGRAITDIALQPSGSLLASASLDHTVQLWDMETGESLEAWNDCIVNRLAFSRDGRLLSGADANGQLCIWDVETYNVRKLEGDPRGLIVVAFSPDGHYVAAAGFSGTAYVWDTKTGQLTATLSGNQGAIWQLVYSPSGDKLVTAGERSAIVWDVASEKQLFVLSSHGRDVRGVAFRPDGRQIATGGTDNVVRLWNAESGALEALLREEFSGRSLGADTELDIQGGVLSSSDPLFSVLSLAYNQSGDRLVSTSGDGLVDIYVVDTEELLRIAQNRVTRQLTCAERVQFLNESLVCE